MFSARFRWRSCVISEAERLGGDKALSIDGLTVADQWALIERR
jgi:hypothetical protein